VGDIISAAQAVRLLAELKELDRATRFRRITMSLHQKQRRAQIALELHRWTLAWQQAKWPGTSQRRAPRANLHLRVQLIGGPRPVELHSDSLAVGGLSLQLNFQPRLGDHLALRLIPRPPDEALEVAGEVVWFNAAKQRVGVQFKGLSEEAEAMLERLVFDDLIGAG
jgi:hypothetical protein